MREALFARVTHGSTPEEIAIGDADVRFAMARLHGAQIEFDGAQTLIEGVAITHGKIDQAERDARMALAMFEEVSAKCAVERCFAAAPISGVVLGNSR
jgi:hypothetical protein